MSPSAPPPPPLTPAQRALFEKEPGLAEEAAEAGRRALGTASFLHLSWEEMVSIATIGALEATVTWNPTAGSSYRTWGFFAALHAVLDAGRVEHQRYAKTRALLRASAMAFFAQAEVGIDLGVDTEASLTDKLHGFSNSVVGLAMLEVAAARPTTGGEDEVAELEAAARAGDALREVLPEVGSDERRMLELRFGEQRPLTEVAAVMGVDARGYRTFVRRFHAVVAALREGLEKRGIRELPPWREAVSGRALAEAPSPPSE